MINLHGKIIGTKREKGEETYEANEIKSEDGIWWDPMADKTLEYSNKSLIGKFHGLQISKYSLNDNTKDLVAKYWVLTFFLTFRNMFTSL